MAHAQTVCNNTGQSPGNALLQSADFLLLDRTAPTVPAHTKCRFRRVMEGAHRAYT